MLDSVPDIMTFNECRKVLKIGKNSLLDIEGFRIGNRWKIPKDALLEYIEHRY